jgi:NDP-sugar pyrophosphorylase family protein
VRREEVAMIPGPEHFFNLKAFEHRGLYGSDDPVWAAIKNLPFYVGAMLAQTGTARGPYRDLVGLRDVDPTVRIAEPWSVLVSPTAVIKPYTVIEGKAVIDDGATVGPHAYLRDSVIVGRGARVGHGTEVKRSVLFPFAKAAHGNRVLDSLIGWNVNLAAHLATMNRRADGRTVPFRLPDGTRLDTGLPKLGIIAGDGCFFGGRVRFDPGDHFLPQTRLI